MAKRTFDLVFSIIGLIIFSPLLLATGILILVTLGWPVLYSPKRTGKANKLFTVRKFRSMKIAPGPTSHHSGDDDPRSTSVGRWIRRFKLDELPQLMNVVRGEMSLVGPRPHAVRHDYVFAAHDSRYWQRFSARPGITGLAQTRGARGEILNVADLNRRVDLDLDYVETCSLWGDIELLVSTLRLLFGDKNAY